MHLRLHKLYLVMVSTVTLVTFLLWLLWVVWLYLVPSQAITGCLPSQTVAVHYERGLVAQKNIIYGCGNDFFLWRIVIVNCGVCR